MSENVSLGTISTDVTLPTTKFEAGRKVIFDGLVGLQDLAKETEKIFAKMELNPDRISLGGELAEKALQSLQDAVAKTKAAVAELNAQAIGTQMGADAKANADGIRAQARAVKALTKNLEALGKVKVDLANSVVGEVAAGDKLKVFGDEIKTLRAECAAPIVQKVSVVRTGGGSNARVNAPLSGIQRAGQIAFGGAGLLTLGAGAVAYDAAQFDYASQIQANNAQGMTPSGLAKLRTLSLALAAKTGQSPEDILAGGKQIEDFGFSAQETRQVLPQAANIATAQGGSVTDAGNALGAFMREFGYKASQAQMAANLIYQAVQSGNLNITQFESSFKRAGAVGANLGVEAPEALAMFTTMTQHGFTGSTAATQTRGFFETAMKTKTPAQQRAEADMDKVMHTHLTQDFSPEGLARLQPSRLLKEIIQGAGGTKNNPGLTQNLSKLFPNLRGFEGLLNVTGKGAADYQAKRSLISGKGNGVAEGASAVEQTGVGQLKILTEQIQQKLIPLGQQLLPLFTQLVPAIKSIADALTSVLSVFNNLPGPVKTLIVDVGAFNLVLKALFFAGILTGLGNIGKAFKWAQIAIKLFGMSFPEVGAALATAGEAIAAFVGGLLAGVTAIGASIAIAVAAIVGFGIAYATNFHHTRDVTNQIVHEMGQILHSVPEAFKEEFGAAIKAVVNFGSEAASAGKGFVDAMVKGVKTAGSSLVDGVKSIVGEVASLLPHSDAKKGPLSTLTASGRAIPETLAKGVRAGASSLTAAVKDALAPTKAQISELSNLLDEPKSKKQKKSDAQKTQERFDKKSISAQAHVDRIGRSAYANENNDLDEDFGAGLISYQEYVDAKERLQGQEENKLAVHQARMLALSRSAQERLAALHESAQDYVIGRHPSERDDAVKESKNLAQKHIDTAYQAEGPNFHGPLPAQVYADALAIQKAYIDRYDAAQKKADDEQAAEENRQSKEMVAASDREQKELFQSGETTLADYQIYLRKRMALIAVEVATVHAATQEQITDLATLQAALNKSNDDNDKDALKKINAYFPGKGNGDETDGGAGGVQVQNWRGALADATGNGIQNAIDHFKTLKGALHDLQTQILDDLRHFLTQLVAQWAKSQLFGTAAGGGNPFASGSGLFGGQKSGTPPIFGGQSGGSDSGGGSSPMGLAQNWLMKGNNALQAGGIAAAGYGLYNAFHKKGRHGLLAKLGMLAGAAGGFMLGGATGAEYGAGLGSWAGGQFANGGRPALGKIHLVGENGPEPFVPDSAGTIIPNSTWKAMASGGASGSGGANHHITINHYGDVNGVDDVQQMHEQFAWRLTHQLDTAKA